MTTVEAVIFVLAYVGAVFGVFFVARNRDRRSYAARALTEFHEHPNSGGDTNGKPLRKALVLEESKELLEALDEGVPEHIAREMADVLYVVWGTAVVYGIDLDAAFQEVHRAAMDKMEAGLKRADGKIMKPPGFVPPDMGEAVRGAP